MSGRALSAFALADAAGVRREPLLALLLASGPLLTVVLRVGDALDVPVPDALAVSFLLVLLVPFILGLLVGLVLLDERDGQVLEALRVTPLSLNGYLAYRCGSAVVLSALVLGCCVPLSGLAGELPRLVPSLLLASLFAPVPALLFAAFASNKVEGLAVMKAFSLLLFLPLLAWFADPRWEPAFGVLPTYWPVKAFWQAEAGATWWPWVAAGAVYDSVLIAWLAARTRRR